MGLLDYANQAWTKMRAKKGAADQISEAEADHVFDNTRAYLEKTFSEAYKRELDQDEAVWRTVPFFVAAMSAFSALLYYCFSQLPALSENFWTVCGYGLAGLSSLFAFAAFCFLAYAVFPRDYQKIPLENEVLKYAREIQDHALAADIAEEARDRHALIDLHNMMIDEFADAVSTNRRNNQKRYFGRAYAALCINVAILLAIPLALGTAVEQKIHAGAAHVAAT